MSRNKYPEETVQKILDIAFGLFTTKGYEQTSIQDIVNELGMSKGAIYHHFKSKEDILKRMCESMYEDESWINAIREDASLNGLEKLRRLFLYSIGDDRKVALDAMTGFMHEDPRVLMESMKSSLQEVAPMLCEIIQEGNRDGSMHVDQPREAAEVLLLLVNLWINPSLFPVEKERFISRVLFYQKLLEGIGMPLVAEKFLKAADAYYDAIHGSRVESGE